ncbi:MAG: CpaF/VirB11 family protein [Clostridiales Family XIII bacterium]|jgi:pilus assembly protein CpaF|nr:CpaF/VirB11 family protein [Clostridiales Family XIII bacterium]
MITQEAVRLNGMELDGEASEGAGAAMDCGRRSFEDICRLVETLLSPGPVSGEMSEAGGIVPGLGAQKRAIIGYDEDVARFMREIGSILDEHGLRGTFDVPAWYCSEEDAVFQEVWGRGGMAQWWRPPYDVSGSAKIIGGDIYFLIDGRMRRMPQRMDKRRREQLIRAFLLLTPEERLDRDFHEIYLLDGCRVTVFKGALTKSGRDVVIFRRYVIPEYSFEEQAARGTIPHGAIPLFESMVRIGFNVAFCGSVRSAKTTFLSTWQRYEDPSLEGVMVETDPEIPLHRIMPGAPIVQLIADGDRLKQVSKNLLRSDADYFIIAEARDGIALDTAVRIARKGTGRVKMTFHTRDPLRFPEDAAVEIVRSMGGEIAETAARVAGSFDYIFHFISLSGSSRKRLKGIYEMGVSEGAAPAIHEICRYSFAGDAWIWTNHISPDKRVKGEESDPAALAAFEKQLACLSGQSGPGAECGR